VTKTFEFTHKTFAEYLTSLRLLRAIEQVSRRMSEHDEDKDSGWEVEESLFRWITLCDPLPWMSI
jgi:hypothetical protein